MFNCRGVAVWRGPAGAAGRMRRADPDRDRRSPADRPRPQGRQAVRRFRPGWHGPHRSRQAASLARRVPVHLAARRDRRPCHPGLLDRRQCAGRRAARHGARLRCPDRRAALALGPGAGARRRPGCGELGRRLADDRRRQCLGADRDRRGARPHVPADHQPEPGFLRRPSPRRQSPRRFRGRPQGRDRRARMELPARPPRSLGLRHPGPAEPRHDHPRRQGARRRHPGDQAGAGLRARPRHRPARPAGRGAPCPAGRRRGRGAVADPALPGRSAAARPRPHHAG